MTREEALKLALDLATMHYTDDGYAELRAKVRPAIKEALAQPDADRRSTESKVSFDQQEPVAVTAEMARAFHRAISDGPLGQADEFEIQTGLEAAFAHITTPPQHKPLTKDEVWDAYMQISAEFDCNAIDLVEFARAIEAKLKQKNGYVEEKNT